MIDPCPPTSSIDIITRLNLNVLVTYDDAKRLTDRGFSVIPIKAKDKTPAIPKRPHNVKKGGSVK